MTAYVDTSVVVKLLVDEAGTAEAQALWSATDDHLAAVPLLAVEARAALAAASRAGRLTPSAHEEAKTSLAALLATIDVVYLSTALLDSAGDLAEAQGLRGYDAVHLAGAVAVADVLVCADGALCDAAERMGLQVANPMRS